MSDEKKGTQKRPKGSRAELQSKGGILTHERQVELKAAWRADNEDLEFPAYCKAKTKSD